MGDFVISISYGNYLIQNGGTDKVIREHQVMFNSQGIDYLFLFPVIRNIKVGKKIRIFRYWGINKNNNFIGLYKIESAFSYIEKNFNQGNKCRALFVHHTWRVQQRDLITILKSFDVPIYYYLHDFYSICDGKNLIDHDGIYCGYGLNGINCKTSCRYYNQSQLNKKNFITLIEIFGERLTFVAPSDNTREIYVSTFDKYATRFVSIPHQKLQGEYFKNNFVYPIKVAFIGKQVALKGWDDYKGLIDRFGNDPDYEFYYLGTGTDAPTNIKVVEVSVRKQGLDAMMNTLRELEIDIVLLLSKWPETYSYTYFEAYAAGCYIITYNCSGNMSDMVKKNGNGTVVSNFYNLKKFFEDKKNIMNILSVSKNLSFPNELCPNEEIVSIVSENPTSNNKEKLKIRSKHRSYFADIMYRIINRRKLHER